MKNKCDFYMDKFLALDKGERIPLSVSLHLLKCKNCRSQVRLLTKSEKLFSKYAKSSSGENSASVKKIIEQIAPDYNPEKYKVTIFQWIIYGILLTVGIFFFIIFARTTQLQAFITSISLAGALCGYSALFVGTNLDFFIKKIDSLNKTSEKGLQEF
ncbi:MAG: hypothetical protein SO116_07715 [Treponema sp.]|nr:hypothetical protein [Spirochaetia bacterium]MDD7013381.1 hypothetical protein [Spirochaetales bacterium]MDY4902740.1 hypothetical protein [Treponema sp.]